MRVPMSWLRDFVELPAQIDSHVVAERLTVAGLKVERVDVVGADIDNVVIARVLEVEELTGFKKPIRWVTLTDGSDERQVICGAVNFRAGDVVAYARPPATLPGGFRIERRSAYGRESDGMICSARELGLGEDHSGILVLDQALPLGADVVETMGLRDDVLDIAVNPDRGYALSIRGVARELATAYGVGFRDPADVTTAIATGGYPVRIEDPSGCDRYVANTVTGIDAKAPSPAWMQRRLTLAGMRPISIAVDITNHVMLELGQPLHAFDRALLRGDIVVRRARAGERIRTLDDVDRELHVDDVVITDDSGPIAIAGVMGGATTEISESTTDVVLEAAHFDPVAIAYTARRHRLMSEASRRFERGVDDAVAPAAAEVAARLLAELAGGSAADVTDVDQRRARPVITLDPALPGQLAGVPYAVDRVRLHLAEVGCAIEGDNPLLVTPPSWRPDLTHAVDLVEEVVRLEDYDNLPSTVPAAPAGNGLTRVQRQRRTVGRALAAGGYAEVLSHPFVSAASADALLLGGDDERRPVVRLTNPISDEEPHLRATLLTGVLATLARNVSRGHTDVALYEIGPVFRSPVAAGSMPSLRAGRPPTAAEMEQLEAALPVQPQHLAIAVCGDREQAGWWGSGRAASWSDAVEAVRTAAAAVGVTLDVSAAATPPWHPGRCARLDIAGREIGHAGELHSRVVEALGLPPRTCAAEVDLGVVLGAAPDAVAAPPMSSYPPATLDVAVVVDADVPVASVAAALRDGAGPMLEQLRLFDVYTGDQVGPGHKSLAFALRFRAPDRTLTAEETVSARDAAVAEAARRVGAVLRGG